MTKQQINEQNYYLLLKACKEALGMIMQDRESIAATILHDAIVRVTT